MVDFVGTDGAPVEPSRSLLDEFKEDMAEAVQSENAVYQHKYRKGYRMTFSTDMDARQLIAWQKAAITDKKRGEVDSIKASAIILGNMNVELAKDGKPLLDPVSHEPMTFQSPFFRESMGVHDSVEAIRKFFVRDGFLQATAESYLKKCGFDDEVDTVPFDD